MAKYNTQVWIGAIALVVIAAVVAYSALGGTGAAAFGGAQAAPTGATGTNQLPNCGNQQPVLQFKTYYLDPTNNNQYTLVSTTGYACTAGVPVCDVSVTTNESKAISSTAGQASCGAVYRQIAGDQGTTYYYAMSQDFTVDNSVVLSPNNNKGLQMIPHGDATATVKSSTALYASSLTFNWSAAGKSDAGVSDTDVMLRVQSPAAPSVYGDLGYAVCFRYQSGNFSAIRVGTNKVAVNHVKPTAVLDTVECWEQAGLTSGAVQELPVYMKGATAGPDNATTVDVILVPKTNELFNGYLIPTENAKAGVTSNGYDKINDNNAAIVSSGDVAYTSMVTITR